MTPYQQGYAVGKRAEEFSERLANPFTALSDMSEWDYGFRVGYYDTADNNRCAS